MNINDVDEKDLPEEITANLWLQKSIEYNYLYVGYREEPDANTGYLCLSEPLEVTFKIKPRKDINKSEIDCLKNSASKIRASAEMKCKVIEEKIQSLLCLEVD